MDLPQDRRTALLSMRGRRSRRKCFGLLYKRQQPSAGHQRDDATTTIAAPNQHMGDDWTTTNYLPIHLIDRRK